MYTLAEGHLIILGSGLSGEGTRLGKKNAPPVDYVKVQDTNTDTLCT